MELLREQGFAVEVTIDQPLNQFGYRGINTTAPLGDRINGEIQIHTEDSWIAKKQTDDLYRKWRDDIEAVTNAQTLPPEKVKAFDDDVARTKALWAAYWAAVPEDVKASISALDSGRDSTMAASGTPVAGPQAPSASTSNRPSSRLHPQMRPSGSWDKLDRSISKSVPQDPGSVKPDSGKLPGGRPAGGTILFDPDEWRRLIAEGRRLFAEGADQFGAWSEAMVTAAGEEVRPVLGQLWQLAVNPAVEPKQTQTATQQGLPLTSEPQSPTGKKGLQVEKGAAPEQDHSDIEDIDARYEAENGNVLNTDSVKLLFCDGGYDPTDEQSVRDYNGFVGRNGVRDSTGHRCGVSGSGCPWGKPDANGESIISRV